MYRNYKTYLADYIASQPRGGRGLRQGLADYSGMQVSHISQVLSGESHFTPEQGEAINSFVGHGENESVFFLLLIQIARAGTPALKKRLEQQIKEFIHRHLVLKNRLGVKELLSPESQGKFYSSWIYGAIHVAVTIKNLQTKEELANYFGLSIKKNSRDFGVSSRCRVDFFQ